MAASLEALGWTTVGREVVEALSLEVSPQWVGVLKGVGNVGWMVLVNQVVEVVVGYRLVAVEVVDAVVVVLEVAKVVVVVSTQQVVPPPQEVAQQPLVVE